MNVENREIQLTQAQFEASMAGVDDLMKLYENIEDVYIKASASMFGTGTVYTSNSTSIARSNAHVGVNPQGA